MNNQIQTASVAKNSNRTSTLAHETRKNRQGLAMFVMTVASQSGAMEADTISKNGRSSKNQTSRGNFHLMIIAFVAIMLSMVSYSCSGDKIPNGTYVYTVQDNLYITFSGKNNIERNIGYGKKNDTYETIIDKSQGVKFIIINGSKYQYILDGKKLIFNGEVYIKK